MVHISNFRPVKRVEDVINIFAKVNSELPATLIMVGDGPCRDEAERLVRSLNLSKKVRFVGKSPDVPQILDLCDLMILPSETESFGLVALEAMASKVPVISTNTGGLPEVNIDGKTGFISDVGDIESMYKNAMHILKDAETLDRFKDNAYKHAQSFDLKNILPEYEKIYCDILKCKNYLESVGLK